MGSNATASVFYGVLLGDPNDRSLIDWPEDADDFGYFFEQTIIAGLDRSDIATRRFFRDYPIQLVYSGLLGSYEPSVVALAVSDSLITATYECVPLGGRTASHPLDWVVQLQKCWELFKTTTPMPEPQWYITSDYG
jgi:hypothetical protein